VTREDEEEGRGFVDVVEVIEELLIIVVASDNVAIAVSHSPGIDIVLRG
jgi:hypothetical protein